MVSGLKDKNLTAEGPGGEELLPQCRLGGGRSRGAGDKDIPFQVTSQGPPPTLPVLVTFLVAETK